MAETNTGGGLSIEARRAVLQSKLMDASRDGWRITSQTDTTAQLYKPKSFNWAVAVVGGVLTAGILTLLYLVEYGMKKDQTAFIEVDEQGQLKVTKSAKPRFIEA